MAFGGSVARRLISAIALVLVALSAPAQPPEQRPIARIVAIEGGVLVSRQFEISSAKAGEALFADARLLVTENSRAVVEYFGGCRIELRAGARFDIATDDACRARTAKRDRRD